MKKKHLKLYYKFLESGKLENHPRAQTNGGLCSIGINKRELRELFQPDDYHNVYWAYGKQWNEKEEGNIEILSHSFTPLRQNILLLLAAIHNEL